ncbi:hypothetical protein M569_05228 [Genlisea aurea]|uniref:Uncharacterized protein n=1 Tax=Genlisea aurea TaxID=192259 RepID=S8CRW0_9LAMI|nr:hypothetical protein M569_05228 [Genlisea aurea]
MAAIPSAFSAISKLPLLRNHELQKMIIRGLILQSSSIASSADLSPPWNQATTITSDSISYYPADAANTPWSVASPVLEFAARGGYSRRSAVDDASDEEDGAIDELDVSDEDEDGSDWEMDDSGDDSDGEELNSFDEDRRNRK